MAVEPPDGSRPAAGVAGTTFPQPRLSVRELRKSYAGRTVLDGVDLDVTAGRFTVLLGANGSGKSTALRCVIGLEAPDGGTVDVSGAQGVAMVFQQPHLIRRRSALDNVCAGGLGRLPLRQSLSPLLFPAALRAEAMACLARVGMADRAADRVSRLSGGQQQRVAIARALCQRPGLLLADEPVSALDPVAADAVLALLAGLAHTEGLAVLAVLHQPDLAARFADRVVGLVAGRVRLDRPADRLSEADLGLLYPAGAAQVVPR